MCVCARACVCESEDSPSTRMASEGLVTNCLQKQGVIFIISSCAICDNVFVPCLRVNFGNLLVMCRTRRRQNWIGSKYNYPTITIFQETSIGIYNNYYINLICSYLIFLCLVHSLKVRTPSNRCTNVNELTIRTKSKMIPRRNYSHGVSH